MPRDVGVILDEIVDAIDGIERAIRDRDIEDYSRDWLLKHGVQRGIEIISEAARHLPDEVLEAAPDIPWKQVRGVGNILRHEYHKISDRIVWNMATKHLPPLREAVEAIRASLET